jgi:hypothetical protein
LPDGLFSNSKIPIWVNFGGPLNGKGWYVLRSVGIFYNRLVYVMAIWYIFWQFGKLGILGILVYFLVFWYISPVLVCFTKQNLATLLGEISFVSIGQVVKVQSRVTRFGEFSPIGSLIYFWQFLRKLQK